MIDPQIHAGAQRQAELEAAKAAFFMSGRQVQVIAIGVSGDRIGTQTMATHHAKLRAQRDKEAPTLRYLSEQGYSVKEAAEAMGTCDKRIRLMASENGIRIGHRL